LFSKYFLKYTSIVKIGQSLKLNIYNNYKINHGIEYSFHFTNNAQYIQGGSNMTGTDFFFKNHNYQTLTCTCQVQLVYKKISPGHI
jgi:hypothetical protein